MNQPPIPTRFVFKVWLWIFVMAAGSIAALAQNTGSGTITGTVTDPTGAAVPGAAVAVRNTNTGTERALVSTADGIYAAPFMQPGMYQITVSKTGFGKVVRTDL